MKGHGETCLTAGFLIKFYRFAAEFGGPKSGISTTTGPALSGDPFLDRFFPSCLKENMRMFRIANSPPSNACSAARRGGQAGRRSTPRIGKRRLAVSARLIIGALFVIHIMFVAGDLAI